jgi:hypothetical protein
MLHRVAPVRATWRNIPEDPILHSHHRENLKSYITLIYLDTVLFDNWILACGIVFDFIFLLLLLYILCL